MRCTSGSPGGRAARQGRMLLIVSETCFAVLAAVALAQGALPAWQKLVLAAIWGIHALTLLRLLRENARTAEKLVQAKEAADHAMLTRGAFLSTMSHEIRTPMNAVLGMAGLLRSTRLDTQQAEFAKAIEDSAHALLGIVNDVLDFSKIDVGKMDIAVVEFDLAKVVEASAEALSFKAREKRVRLLAHLDSRLPPRLVGDPGRIRQILLNLLGNALKFTHAGEVLLRVQALQVTSDHCRVRFEVRDSGIGMDEDTLRRLFSPFAQADSSVTRQYGGTGLGLSICKRLVELMGGSIGVESALGTGSCFWFELGIPVTTGPGMIRSEPPAADRPRRIALVEPHDASAAMLHEYLRSAALETLRFGSASDALAALTGPGASASGIDAVIVSTQVQDLDAVSVMARLQAERPALRRVLLDHGVHGLDTGSKPHHEVLQLPLRKQQLLRALGVTDSAAEAQTSPHARMAAPATPRQGHSGQRDILLVEDNVMNQKVAVYQLNAMGYAADIAANGLEALERLARHRYALVLMDCQMPLLDGYETTRRIRRMQGELAHTTIVAMTANAMAGDRERCLEAGMDDYLTKPLLRSQLSAMLAHYLPPSAASAGSAPAAPQLIDEDRLQELFGQDRALAHEMLAMFVEHTSPLMQELQAHCQDQEPALDEVQALGHRLAGSCMNLGLDALGQLGREMEMAARQGDLAQTRTRAQACAATFAQLCQHLQASQTRGL
ncbi:response regulator [Herbaspirillum seropedicae]|uniref:Virulence sensor protein BvgS n=2 Tax=Herbaspirillum seropedicae TaxID=964 RepID=D8INT0_HERSS|nr:ATP-binding protein [Herbaspirillum seropedicae]ADJ62750.1 Hpt sensor hybrid histidine kinase protein [Herbaspirillum seropedicae SmR1]UMU20795.1 response regulator [Herbaspirillum seropedicae]